MKLRSPFVIKIQNVSETKTPFEYKLSQLQLFHPFTSEIDLGADNEPTCINLYRVERQNINVVKKLLFPHLNEVLNAVESFEPATDITVNTLAPDHQQDNDDCMMEGTDDHPDFLIKDPAQYLPDVPDVPNSNKIFYPKIILQSEDEIRRQTQSLDEDQRRVFDILIDYIIRLKRWKTKVDKFKGAPPSPPHMCLQGQAGAGKSTLIDVLTQRIESIMRLGGDDPDHPYILKAARTGTAASNIGGQTLHSAFKLNFSLSKYTSLPAETLQSRAPLLNQLAILIIDEFSLAAPEMLYHIHMRLNEIKGFASIDYIPFGGICVILAGDLTQLCPFEGRYIFEKPLHGDGFKLLYSLDRGLWGEFDFYFLTKNHRQGSSGEYAEILKRISMNAVTDKDMAILQTRWRNKTDKDLPTDALRLMLTNEKVNHWNAERLNMIPGDLVRRSVKMTCRNTRSSQIRTNNDGTVCGTQIPAELCLKKNCRVIMTANVDTSDLLVNGAFGEVVDFELKTNENNEQYLHTVLVRFDRPNCGEKMREKRPDLKYSYPVENVTPVGEYEMRFTLGKTDNSKSGSATNIPLRLAFASTIHKIQGGTIYKPNKVVIDLSGRCPNAAGYVALSRVQELEQIFITGDFNKKKLKANPRAMAELETMWAQSLNNQQTVPLITSFNAFSLNGKFDDIRTSPIIFQSQVVCIQETCFPKEYQDQDIEVNFHVDGYELKSVGRGKGKGIIIYYSREFMHATSIEGTTYWMVKIISSEFDVINVYRSSSDSAKSNFLNDLMSLINRGTDTYIVGDFNIDYITKSSSKIPESLKSLGFTQYVKYATHREGSLLDHVYSNTKKNVRTIQEAHFFSDHDLVYVTNQQDIEETQSE